MCYVGSPGCIYPSKINSGCTSQYKEHINKLNFTDVNFPFKVQDVPKVEKLNDISINVFGFEHGEVIPLHITPTRASIHVNLLLISKGDKQHYVWIKNLDRLLSDQNKHHARTYFCSYCLHGFSKEKLLKDHVAYCQIHGPQKIELPSEEDRWLFYKDVGKQLRVL